MKRDQMVLAPFRGLGTARNLLADWSEHAAGEAPRSLLINCDDGSSLAMLYRNIGFTDEVYWHRRYQRLDLAPQE